MRPLQEDKQSVPAYCLVDLCAASGGTALGRLDVAHLGDHPAGVAALADALAVGAELGPLLVLERLQVRQRASFGTAKSSVMHFMRRSCKPAHPAASQNRMRPHTCPHGREN